jgi:glucosamine-6-phosphate deaminase
MGGAVDLRIVRNHEELSRSTAELVVEHVNTCPDTILVLPTGNTPLGMYRELVSMAEVGKVDFSQCQAGQLDEYWGITLDDPRSFFAWLEGVFIDPAGIKHKNTIRINSSAHNPDEEAARVEGEIKKRGGIGLAILGLGLNGHLAFNEPGSEFDSRTRVIDLTPETIKANSKYWGETRIPSKAMTLGLGTIAEARELLLLVSGMEKAEILPEVLHGPIGRDVPATCLRKLPRVTVIADRPAASLLPTGEGNL